MIAPAPPLIQRRDPFARRCLTSQIPAWAGAEGRAKRAVELGLAAKAGFQQRPRHSAPCAVPMHLQKAFQPKLVSVFAQRHAHLRLEDSAQSRGTKATRSSQLLD